MNGFGHLQVELGPFSLPPLFNPLPKLGASSTATLFVLWDVVEHFGAGQSVLGWCQLTPASQVFWGMILRYCGPVFSKSLGVGRVKRVGLGIFRFASLSVSLFETEGCGSFYSINALAECKRPPCSVEWASGLNWWKVGNSELLPDTFCFSLEFFHMTMW